MARPRKGTSRGTTGGAAGGATGGASGGATGGSSGGATGGSSAGTLAKRSAEREKYLAEVQELAHLLDNTFRIPVINYRFGIDALIGLVPVVGDFTAFGLSSWIIYRAARMGAPRSLLAKMTANALGDTLVGSIPGLGTAVDFVWKANARNLKMLERFLAEDR